MSGTASMRVVMFDPGCFLPYYIDQLCVALHAMGVRPRVISSPPLFEPVQSAEHYDVEEVFFPFLRDPWRTRLRRHRLIRQGIKALSYPSGLARVRRIVGDGAPGVLHLQWSPFPLLDRHVVRDARRRGWRVIYTLHDPLPRLGRRHHLELLRLVHAVIVHTPQQRTALLEVAPFVADRVRVIPHGVSRWSPPSAAERARHVEALGLPPGRRVLLFFGLLKRYKGLEHLLQAMPEVIRRYPETLLVIAGEPLMPLAPVEQRIRSLGLHDHVVLRAGFVPSPEVPRYFRAADLLVAPYLTVGASGVVASAQAHALPVVCTNVGGLPDFVQHEESGLLVPPADPGALGLAIARALGDPGRLTEMGCTGWQRLGSFHGWSDVAERTLAVYHGTETATPFHRSDAPTLPLHHP